MIRALLLLMFLLSTTAGAQIPTSLYVLNSIGENVSVVNLENQTVNADALTAGLFPNHIITAGQRGYIVNSGTNDIQEFDLASLSVVQNIDTGGGTNPWAMVLIENDLAAVSLLFTNAVHFFNPQTGLGVTDVTVGTGPQGMVFVDGKLYVANSGFNGAGYDPGEVTAIDVGNYTTETIAVSTNPQALAVDSQGRIVVCCTGDYANENGTIEVIDPVTNTVVSSVPANTFITNIAVAPNDNVYAATFSTGVLVYNPGGQFFERDAGNPLPGGPGLAIDADGVAYISDFGLDSVYVYSPDHTRLGAYLVGDGPLSLALYQAPAGFAGAGEALPKEIRLLANYPNPFNPETTIRFATARAGYVELAVYDVSGRLVRRLIDGGMPAGDHRFQWDGRDDRGRAVVSGMYILRLESGGEMTAAGMHLVR